MTSLAARRPRALFAEVSGGWTQLSYRGRPVAIGPGLLVNRAEKRRCLRNQRRRGARMRPPRLVHRWQMIRQARRQWVDARVGRMQARRRGLAVSRVGAWWSETLWRLVVLADANARLAELTGSAELVEAHVWLPAGPWWSGRLDRHEDRRSAVDRLHLRTTVVPTRGPSLARRRRPTARVRVRAVDCMT